LVFVRPLSPVPLASAAGLRLSPRVDDSKPDDARERTDITFGDDATDEIALGAVVVNDVVADLGKIAGFDETASARHGDHSSSWINVMASLDA